MVLGKYLFFLTHNMDIYDKLKAIQIMIDNNEITDDDVPYIQLVLKNMQNDVQTMIKKGDLEQLVPKTDSKKPLPKVEKNKTPKKQAKKSVISKKPVTSKKPATSKNQKTSKNPMSKKVQSGGAEEQSLEEDDSDETTGQKVIEESTSQILKEKLNQIENLYSFNVKNDDVLKESIDSIITKEIEKLGNRGQPPSEDNIVSNQYSESSNLPGCIIS